MAPAPPPSGRSAGLGLWTLVALVVGDMIGAGVYTTSGLSLGALGSRGLVMAGWAVAGLLALCGAASYAMLARRLTQSGGEYLYLRREIHPVAGSIAGYVSLLAGFTGAIAFAAATFGVYARAAVPALAAMPSQAIGAAVIVAAGLVHLARTGAGAALNTVMVVVKLVALTAFCVWAATLIGARPVPVPPAPAPPPFRLTAFGDALVWISLSYSGFNAAIYVAGEARDPARSVPRAILIGTALTLLLYLATNFAFLYAAPYAAIAGQADIAGRAAFALGGPPARHAVAALILVSLATAILSMLLAGPRVYAQMARDGVLPRWLAGGAAAPPRAAILFQVALAVVATGIASLRDLLSYLGFALSLSAAFAVSTLFVRHVRTGERPASRAYPLAPALFVAGTLACGLLAALAAPLQFAATAATILVGVAAHLLRRPVAARDATG
ncbi:APC family permease [Sphingomonas montana]|uniref:APC family permease n=1 Tax=Sphingomonas montana TaxID=1843236 RepID=UPI00096CDC3C|nr:APC family permease [Sphingomonas montana]